MTIKSLGGLVFAGLLMTAAGASAQSASSNELAHCARQTHAPGSYEIANQSIVPGAGGTSRGARAVADCIADLRGIQYDVEGFAVAAAAPVSAPSGKCARLANRSGGEAAMLAIGAGLVGGYVGVGIHGAVVTKNLQDCSNAGALGGNSTITYASACGRNSNPIFGGSGYCRR